jgi:hypothetical protein
MKLLSHWHFMIIKPNFASLPINTKTIFSILSLLSPQTHKNSLQVANPSRHHPCSSRIFIVQEQTFIHPPSKPSYHHAIITFVFTRLMSILDPMLDPHENKAMTCTIAKTMQNFLKILTLSLDLHHAPWI